VNHEFGIVFQIFDHQHPELLVHDFFLAGLTAAAEYLKRDGERA
jgi:hypothetical protein